MEGVEAIPYAVVVRMCDIDEDWQWEAKIEEIGLLAYGPTKEDVFKNIMEKYKKWLRK
jgi:hypothetical protein